MKNEIEILKSQALILKQEFMNIGLEDYSFRSLDELLEKGVEKILCNFFSYSYLPGKYQDITKYCLKSEDISDEMILELKKKADEKEEADKYEALIREAYYLVRVNEYTNKSSLTKRNNKSLSFDIYANFDSDVVEKLSQMIFLFTGNKPNSFELSDKIKPLEGRDQNYNRFWSGKFQLGNLIIQLFKNRSCVITFETAKDRDQAFNNVVELAKKSNLNNKE